MSVWLKIKKPVKLDLSITTTVSQRLNIKKLHQHLAHTSNSKIKTIIKNNVVNGLSACNNEDYKCDPCLEMRATKPVTLFYGARKNIDTREVFFSVDLCPESIHLNKYFFICKDEATSYREVYFTNSKSERGNNRENQGLHP